MKEKTRFIRILRPDGSRVELLVNNIAYVQSDLIDDSGNGTEIYTMSGISFIVKKPIDEVMQILKGEKEGDL